MQVVGVASVGNKGRHIHADAAADDRQWNGRGQDSRGAVFARHRSPPMVGRCSSRRPTRQSPTSRRTASARSPSTAPRMFAHCAGPRHRCDGVEPGFAGELNSPGRVERRALLAPEARHRPHRSRNGRTRPHPNLPGRRIRQAVHRQRQAVPRQFQATCAGIGRPKTGQPGLRSGRLKFLCAAIARMCCLTLAIFSLRCATTGRTAVASLIGSIEFYSNTYLSQVHVHRHGHASTYCCPAACRRTR